jgi:hypothetical protein
MENLTPEQVANFVYWVTEKIDNKGISKYNGRVRVAHIQYDLLCEFLKKYPQGILTGWSKENNFKL